MQSHTIDILKLWRHSGIVIHSISQYFDSEKAQIYFWIFLSKSFLRPQIIMKIKKLFLFWRYSIFCISLLLFFSPVIHWLRGWSKINFKVDDVSNCLNNYLITHFFWFLEKEKINDNKTLQIYEKSLQKMCTKS